MSKKFREVYLKSNICKIDYNAHGKTMAQYDYKYSKLKSLMPKSTKRESYTMTNTDLQSPIKQAVLRRYRLKAIKLGNTMTSIGFESPILSNAIKRN